MLSEPKLPIGLQGLKRRVVFVGLYELIAIAIVTFGLSIFTGQGASRSSAVAVASSAIAVLWNLVFNWGFERWESRQDKRGRGIGRRIVHAVGFECGLIIALVPLFAWWFGIGLLEAFLMDLGLVIFFLGYTFVFSWAFDALFGLPAVAQGSVPMNGG